MCTDVSILANTSHKGAAHPEENERFLNDGGSRHYDEPG